MLLTFRTQFVEYKLFPEGMGEIDRAYAALIFKWFTLRDPNDTEDPVAWLNEIAPVLTMHPGNFRDTVIRQTARLNSEA